MVKKIFLFILVVAFILGQTSCKKITGKGNVVTESRSVSGYTAINLSISGDVFYTPDTTNLLTLTSQQNVLDVIETRVEGGSLVIRLKEHYSLGKHERLQVNIHAPGIKQTNINGSGTLNFQAPWHGNSLSIDISGSGDVYLSDIEAHEIHANISGSGSIHGNTGVTDYLGLNISGSGNINFQNLEADTVYANISGSGDMSVWAVKMMDGTISGSGNIYYRGTPVIYTHISGSGSIRPL